jgi:hypothetical protein
MPQHLQSILFYYLLPNRRFCCNFVSCWLVLILQTFCSIICQYTFMRIFSSHYATSRKVTGLILDEVIGFFN